MKRVVHLLHLFPFEFTSSFGCKTPLNKKVLLHECKRHTARRVASAPYAALSNGAGVSIQSWLGGTPSQIQVGGRGYSIQSWLGGTHPRFRWGYPIQSWPVEEYFIQSSPGGYSLSPCWGYPIQSLLGVPWGSSPVRPGMGYPCPANGGSPPPT